MSVKLNNITSDSLLVIDTECDLYQQTTFSLPPHCLQEAQNGNDLVTLGYVNSLVGQYSGGFNLFFNYSVPDGIYRSLGQSVVDSGTQQIVPITTDTTNQLVAKFVSPVLGITTIPSGIWNMLIYSEVVSNGGTLTYFFEVYKLTGITETLLFTSASSADVNANNTPAGFNVNGTLISPATIALTDKIVIKIYLHKDGTPLLVNTYFQYAYYSFIQTTLNAGTTLLSSNNTFTGTNDFTLSPTVPTKIYPSNTTDVATTAFVSSNFVNLDTTQSITGTKTMTKIITNNVDWNAINGTINMYDLLTTAQLNIGKNITSGNMYLGNAAIPVKVSGLVLTGNDLQSSTPTTTLTIGGNLVTNGGHIFIGSNQTTGNIAIGGGARSSDSNVNIMNGNDCSGNLQICCGNLNTTVISIASNPNNNGAISIGSGVGSQGSILFGSATRVLTVKGKALSSIDITPTGTINCGAITGSTYTGTSFGGSGVASSFGTAGQETSIIGSSILSGTITTANIIGNTALSVGAGTTAILTLGKSGGQTNILGTSASSSISIGTGTVICGAITAPSINSPTLNIGRGTTTTLNIGLDTIQTNLYGSSSSQLTTGLINCVSLNGLSGNMTIGTLTTTGDLTIGKTSRVTTLIGGSGSEVQFSDAGSKITCPTIVASVLDSVALGTVSIGNTNSTTTQIGRAGGITNILGTSASSSISIGTGTVICGAITAPSINSPTLAIGNGAETTTSITLGKSAVPLTITGSTASTITTGTIGCGNITSTGTVSIDSSVQLGSNLLYTKSISVTLTSSFAIINTTTLPAGNYIAFTQMTVTTNALVTFFGFRIGTVASPSLFGESSFDPRGGTQPWFGTYTYYVTLTTPTIVNFGGLSIFSGVAPIISTGATLRFVRIG